MNKLTLAGTTLVLGAIVALPSHAQPITYRMPSAILSAALMTTNMDHNVVLDDPAIDGKIDVIAEHATTWDKYRADWLYRNLDQHQVDVYRAQGVKDWVIACSANVAMRANLPLDFVLDQIRIGGYTIYDVADKYGVRTRDVSAPLPEFGEVSVATAPHEFFVSPIATVASWPDPYSTSTAASASLPPVVNATAATGDLASTLAADPRFSTLYSLMRSAGLTANLQMPGPFTLFAPTNDAFAKLPPSTLDNLMQPQNQAQLRSILLYHLVSGKILTSVAMGMAMPGSPKTLEGESITVSNTVPIIVNGAVVIASDIDASNGEIQGIDAVLMPPTIQNAMAAPATPAAPSSPAAPATPAAPSSPAAPTSPSPATPSVEGTPAP